jgi:hypothetical protein
MTRLASINSATSAKVSKPPPPPLLLPAVPLLPEPLPELELLLELELPPLLLLGAPAAASAKSACTKPQPDESLGTVVPIGDALLRSAE